MPGNLPCGGQSNQDLLDDVSNRSFWWSLDVNDLGLKLTIRCVINKTTCPETQACESMVKVLKVFFLSLHTGWYPPGSGHGDVLWLSIPPGPDRGPWSAKDGTLRGHGYDCWMAGHYSLNSNSNASLMGGGAVTWHQPVRLLMVGPESLRELGWEVLSCVTRLTAPCLG